MEKEVSQTTPASKDHFSSQFTKIRLWNRKLKQEREHPAWLRPMSIADTAY